MDSIFIVTNSFVTFFKFGTFSFLCVIRKYGVVIG